MRIITGLAAFLIIAVSCDQKQEASQDHLTGVQALMWSQFSAEAEALYIQGYNIAGRIVKDSAAIQHEKPWAVILDIDETVLDNSPFDVERKRNSMAYSEEIWGEWCERREAIALPGALEFTLLAEQLGVEVFYISNRRVALLEPTLDNLNDLGFPFSDTIHVVLKTETSSKDARRAAVMTDHEILLMIGDNLGDFDGIFDDRSENFGKNDVRKMKDEFGSRFIMLPNPMYGKWEGATFAEGRLVEEEVLEKLRGY